MRTIIIYLVVISGSVFGGLVHSNAEEYKFPDTGQHTCYDDQGNEITCPAPGEPFYGQDAQYQGAEPAYQDNGDGTVTDLNTGLIWQQATADIDGDGDMDSNDELVWQEACDYCNSLTFASHSDWRIPNRRELLSIVDYGRHDPAINPVFDCRSSNRNYWSGSTSAYDTDYAWQVTFNYGTSYYSGKNFLPSVIRCLRGVPIPSQTFQDNGDGTVTDTVNDLMWQQNEGWKMSWKEALANCEECATAGYTDWRLPNVRELESLVDLSRHDPTIDTVFGCISNSYWSGSSRDDYLNNGGWGVTFRNGYVNSPYKDPDVNELYVRCVRGELVTKNSKPKAVARLGYDGNCAFDESCSLDETQYYFGNEHDKYVDEGDNIILDGSCSKDPDNDKLKYFWRNVTCRDLYGSIGTDGKNMMLVAQEVDKNRECTFRLTVDDEISGKDSDELTVTIINLQSCNSTFKNVECVRLTNNMPDYSGVCGIGHIDEATRNYDHIGTGFLVDNNKVLTCWHVIEDHEKKLDNLKIKFISSESKDCKGLTSHKCDETYFIDKIIKHGNKGYFNRGKDYCLLQLTSNVNNYNKIYKLNKNITVNKNIYAYGFPDYVTNGLFKSVSSGKITKINENYFNNYFNSNINLDDGASGGPVFNLTGEVIGLTRGEYNNIPEHLKISSIYEDIKNKLPPDAFSSTQSIPWVQLLLHE